jgi:hypothetical protein
MTELIHQIYCTHCTYGTSALERREGELAGRPLGYSARSSSLEMNELRKQYRLLERFLYYYLPSDSPSEDRLRLEADTAPRRLVASLSLSGSQMLAQISYRQFDTAGRPGSYFAHVLIGPRGQQPWPATQCLQLWGAPWIDTDTPDLPFDLPPLTDLSDLLAGQRPAIDDGLLLGFLTTEPGEPLDDPRDVIPPRWRAIAAQQRRELFADALQGFIRLGSASRDNVLLVIEPSLSALLYYGIARLLPAGEVQSSLGFSTFEPALERALVPLAATIFRQPEVTDARPELYRGRSSIRNTFLDKRGGPAHPAGPYVELVLDTLLREGWPAVDRLLAGFGEAGVKRLEDLDSLGRAHRAAPAMLFPNTPLDAALYQQSPLAAGYLASQVRRELAGCDARQLQALVGSAQQSLILELVATSVAAITAEPSVIFLLSALSGDQLARWLASNSVGPACKVAALANIIVQQGRLPEACAFVWRDEAGVVEPKAGAAELKAGAALPIMTAVLLQLPQPALEQLYGQLAEPERPSFLRHLVRACGADPSKLAMLQLIFSELSEAHLCAVLREQGPELRRIYPQRDAELGARLHSLLLSLPNQSREFGARLDLLNAWQAWLPDQLLDKRQLQLWQRVRSALQAIGEARSAPPPGMLQKITGQDPRPSLDDLARKAAAALGEAVPAPFQQPEGFAVGQQRLFQALGAALLGDTEFLPSGLVSKTAWFFENHHWPPSVVRGRSSSGLRTPLIAAAVILVLCGVVGFGLMHNRPVPKIADAPPVSTPKMAPQTQAAQHDTKPAAPVVKQTTSEVRTNQQRPNTSTPTVPAGQTAHETPEVVAPGAAATPAGGPTALPQSVQPKPRDPAATQPTPLGTAHEQKPKPTPQPGGETRPSAPETPMTPHPNRITTTQAEPSGATSPAFSPPAKTASAAQPKGSGDDATAESSDAGATGPGAPVEIPAQAETAHATGAGSGKSQVAMSDVRSTSGPDGPGVESAKRPPAGRRGPPKMTQHVTRRAQAQIEWRGEQGPKAVTVFEKSPGGNIKSVHHGSGITWHANNDKLGTIVFRGTSMSELAKCWRTTNGKVLFQWIKPKDRPSDSDLKALRNTILEFQDEEAAACFWSLNPERSFTFALTVNDGRIELPVNFQEPNGSDAAVLSGHVVSRGAFYIEGESGPLNFHEGAKKNGVFDSAAAKRLDAEEAWVELRGNPRQLQIRIRAPGSAKKQEQEILKNTVARILAANKILSQYPDDTKAIAILRNAAPVGYRQLPDKAAEREEWANDLYQTLLTQVGALGTQVQQTRDNYKGRDAVAIVNGFFSNVVMLRTVDGIRDEDILFQAPR